MSIYTKTGDKGTTSLANGKRVLKSDPIIEAYGSVDELNSFLGLAIFKAKERETKELLTNIQKNLSQVAAVLAGKNISLQGLTDAVNNFEQIIDKYQAKLPKLDRFILPKGTETSCYFHILRTICRRTERNIVKVKNDFSENKINLIIKYFNRLSDLFFVLSRWYNRGQEIII